MSFEATVEQRIDLLRAVWLFSSCTDDELGRIGALTRPREFDAATEIMRQGDEGDEFYVVVEGEASAVVDGDEVGTIGPGGFFGEMALLDGAERVASVFATTPMKVLVLDRHDFNEMLAIAMPEITPKLLAVVGARMRAIEQHDGVASTLGL
jgi:CRP-like cAMP-binding protein